MERMGSKKFSSAHEHVSMLLTASMLCLFSVSTIRAELAVAVSDIPLVGLVGEACEEEASDWSEMRVFKISRARVRQPCEVEEDTHATLVLAIDIAWSLEDRGDDPDALRGSALDNGLEVWPRLMALVVMRSDATSFRVEVMPPHSSRGSPKEKSMDGMKRSISFTSELKSTISGDIQVSENAEKMSGESPGDTWSVVTNVRWLLVVDSVLGGVVVTSGATPPSAWIVSAVRLFSQSLTGLGLNFAPVVALFSRLRPGR